MTSKIRENILFYLSSTREKSRSIAINHDLNLKNEMIIKLLVQNCRFKFDLLLMESLKLNYLKSDFKIENIYSLADKLNEEQGFDEQINKLEKSIENVYPESCLIVDSINLLILNYDLIKINKFIDHLLSKYSKVIFLFNGDLVDSDYLFKLQELCTAYFELNRKSFINLIQVQFVYKKKCQKLGLNLVKGDYSFSFDANTYMAKLIEIDVKSSKQQTKSEDFSYDLSFNSTIKEDDQEREQIVLPFMR